MALRDPVAIYNAASNLQAIFVRDALIAAGVNAFAIEDVSQVGTWLGGLIPEIHKPQVWVEREDVERARPVLEEFERRAKELRDARDGAGDALEPVIEVVCEECGYPGLFPVSQRGSVQECPDCGAYIDVEEPGASGNWEAGEGVTEEQ